MDIKEAKKMLAEANRNADDEVYHIQFDKAIELRLQELDPKFMAQMDRLYRKSGLSRWYA